MSAGTGNGGVSGSPADWRIRLGRLVASPNSTLFPIAGQERTAFCNEPEERETRQKTEGGCIREDIPAPQAIGIRQHKHKDECIL